MPRGQQLIISGEKSDGLYANKGQSAEVASFKRNDMFVWPQPQLHRVGAGTPIDTATTKLQAI